MVEDSQQLGIRLDKFISTLPEVGSRNRGEFLITEGLVTVNKKIRKSSYLLCFGDVIEVELPQPEPSDLQPLNAPLNIVFEDEFLLVINKPSGLVVHPAAGHTSDTLVNILLYHRPEITVGLDQLRPGIVHRLDKETSGLLVIAKDSKTQTDLMTQFKNRTTHRIYYAVVSRRPKNESGRIESIIARHPTDRKKFSSIKEKDSSIGKWAATNYQVLGSLNNEVSYLSLKLETGRTHQIRVHLSELGHPLIGDLPYGFKPKESYFKSLSCKKFLSQCERVMLHAAELGFRHPATYQAMNFKVDWPEPEKNFLKELGFLK